MPTRRHALRTAAFAAASASLPRARAVAAPDVAAFPPRRPPRGERRFTSPAVEATIAAVKRDGTLERGHRLVATAGLPKRHAEFILRGSRPRLAANEGLEDRK